MNRAIAALVAILLIPAAGRAQPMPAPAPMPAPPPPRPAERAGDRFETRQDRRELRDDRRDLFWSESLLARYDDAVRRRARRALAAVENDILQTLDRELREARFELMKSRHEARRSAEELRGDAAMGDRREMRDARRDVRDDRRDLFRVKAIRSEFWSLRGRLDRRSIERKRGLVAELVHMARAEVHEDRRELREDRREGWDHTR